MAEQETAIGDNAGTAPLAAKRGPGRPPGSKNKRKLCDACHEGEARTAAELEAKRIRGEVLEDWVPDDIFNFDQGRTIAIVSEKEAGKTNLVLNIVDPAMFDRVWLITRNRDGELSGLVEGKGKVLPGLTEAFLAKLLENQWSTPKPKRHRVLIMLDDYIGSEFNFRQSNALKEIGSSNRHTFVSVLFSTQKFKEVPDIIRKNAQHWFFGVNVRSSIDQIVGELSTAQLEPIMFRKKLLRIAADENFSFLNLRSCRPRGYVTFIPPQLKDDNGTLGKSKTDKNAEKALQTPGQQAAEDAEANGQG